MYKITFGKQQNKIIYYGYIRYSVINVHIRLLKVKLIKEFKVEV